VNIKNILTDCKNGCLIQAFYKEEYFNYPDTAVPVDQIFINYTDTNCYLFLPSGDYIIRGVDSNRNITDLYEYDFNF